MSRNAPEFTDYAADLIKRWSEFEHPIYHGGATSSFKLSVKTNWKLAVENYSESYHLPWVHPGLNSYSRLEDHYHIEGSDNFSGQGTLVYRQMVGEGDLKLPDHKDLSDKWTAGAEYVTIYPNVLLGVHRDHCFAIILDGKSTDETVEHVELYYAKDIASDPTYQTLIEQKAALWKSVFEEDIFVVEGMQKGRAATSFDGGKFSPEMDGPTHMLHAWIATQLSND